MALDETDVKIIKKLLFHARLSYRTIAEEINVSAPTVLSRVEKLEKDNIIKFYSAILDHEKVGYDLTAIIEVTAVKGRIADVEKHVSKFPNGNDLSNFVKKDLLSPSIERTNTHIVLITVKEDFRFI